MTEFIDLSSGPRRRLRGLFPTPLVGVASILAVLIVLTPVLFESGPPLPGSLLAQAELTVDRVSGGNSTTFYIRAVGEAVRYTAIDIGLATGFVWSGGFPGGRLDWTDWNNQSDVLEASVRTGNGSVAINVTAEYTEGGGTAFYWGVVAFNVSGSIGTGETLSIAVSGLTPGVAAPSSIAVGDLPLSMPLQDIGSSPP
jgi:hypothetical protein